MVSGDSGMGVDFEWLAPVKTGRMEGVDRGMMDPALLDKMRCMKSPSL